MHRLRSESTLQALPRHIPSQLPTEELAINLGAQALLKLQHSEGYWRFDLESDAGMSAEYILSHGNQNVMLCERGIRTFETSTRNTLDINAVPVLKELTHLPVIVDPSHATGKASLVKAVSKAAVAAGADGLLIEVHPNPEKALSDGSQSLKPQQFVELMGEVGAIAQATGRAI